MLKNTLVVVVLGVFSVAAMAGDLEARNAAKQTIALQDGSIAYVFPSGKMAVENRYGNVVNVKPGTVLKTSDGSSVTMVGNEVAYLEDLLRQGEGN